MDNLTHTLFGLTLGRTLLGRAGRGTTAALVIASNVPDIDVITALPGGLSYLHWHRGPTHGPLGIVGLGIMTAGAVWVGDRIVDRWRSRPSQGRQATFAVLAAVSMIAALCHVLMDLTTSYGTRFLSPFDWHWYSLDWSPIVDIYLLAILAAGLIFMAASPAATRTLAALVLVLVAANYGVRAAAHRQALASAPRLFGPLLPQPCDEAAPAAVAIAAWPQARKTVSPNGLSSPCLVEIAAIPALTSPFRWQVIARLPNSYELHELDLLNPALQRGRANDSFWRQSLRYPNQWTRPVTDAAATQAARIFLGFSRFPAARSFVDSSGTATVRWTDMRFVGGVFGLLDRAHQPDPFTVVVRLAADGHVEEQQLQFR